jgi:hypothetical protein
MYGFTIIRGNLDLEGTASNPLTITTADGASPIYIRDQAVNIGPAGITLKYVSINNIGTSANGGTYAGIVATTSLVSSVAVDVENSQFLNYYRLLQGGTA